MTTTPRARRQPKREPAAIAGNFTAGVDDEADAEAGVPSASASSSDIPAQPAGHDDSASPDPPGRGGVVMSDDEAIPPQFLRSRSSPDGEAAPAGAHTSVPQVSAATARPGVIAYEHRIRVLEAFHYPGNMTGAPDWVDRNWLAYGDYDEKRKLPAGPALNVPTPRHPTGFTLCRKGDYIVRQEILLSQGLPPSVQVEVWEKDEFERLFIPVHQPVEEAA